MRRSRGAVMNFIFALSVMAMCFATVNWAAAQDNPNQTDVEKRIKASATVLDEIMGVKDKAIPDKIMSDAKCVAVVPSMVKIAVGFGGSHGKGVATCRTANGWSAPAPFTITGGSWGLQLGGQAIDLVMLVMNQKGMDDLLSSKFKIGGTASAAAGPVGRAAAADTDWKMKAEILSYSRARGIFAGVDLSGSKIAQDRDETHILYGKMVPFATILSGKVAPPNGSEPFLAAVRKYSMQSREQGSVGTSSDTTTAQK
ncbi:MAG TPA: lipid-binding SYLF domain-containing protein [Terriglobales bacterium]|nr:lipid-binding SYLF domain-containing protein [Terriglobales bacterium]